MSKTPQQDVVIGAIEELFDGQIGEPAVTRSARLLNLILCGTRTATMRGMQMLRSRNRGSSNFASTRGRACWILGTTPVSMPSIRIPLPPGLGISTCCDGGAVDTFSGTVSTGGVPSVASNKPIVHQRSSPRRLWPQCYPQHESAPANCVVSIEPS